MKYKITYTLPSQPKKTHYRYYNALNKSTALEMFSATCEESLAGESPLNISAQEVSRNKKRLEPDNITLNQ